MYLTIHLLLCVTCTISHNIGFIFIDTFLTLVHWKSKTKLHQSQRVNGPCFIFYLWLYNLNEWIHPSLSSSLHFLAILHYWRLLAELFTKIYHCMIAVFDTNGLLWIHLISLVPIFVDWEKKAFCGIVKFVDCRLQKFKKKVLKYLNSRIFTSNS